MTEEHKKYKLYLKTHNITGLKYLGKTIRDPLKYDGSGKRWRNHIKIHGNDINTEVIFSSENLDEFNFVASVVSYTLDVVDSVEFANIVHEEGSGGDTFSGRIHTEETKSLMREAALVRPPVSQETRSKISKSKIGKKTGKKAKRTKEHAENLSKALKGRTPWNKGKSFKRKVSRSTCYVCGRIGLTWWIDKNHNENCELIKPEHHNS